MKLSETELVYEVEVYHKKDISGNELRLSTGRIGVAFDRKTAKEFLPVLQHFIKTGEMLK